MKLKCYILASETCETRVQLTVRSYTFPAAGASQISRAPRVFGSPFIWLPAVGLPAALSSKERGSDPSSAGVTHPFWVIFSHTLRGGNQDIHAPAENGTKKPHHRICA